VTVPCTYRAGGTHDAQGGGCGAAVQWPPGRQKERRGDTRLTGSWLPFLPCRRASPLPGRHSSIKIHSCRRSQATFVPAAGELSRTPEPDGCSVRSDRHVDGCCTGPSLPEGAAGTAPVLYTDRQHVRCFCMIVILLLRSSNSIIRGSERLHSLHPRQCRQYL